MDGPAAGIILPRRRWAARLREPSAMKIATIGLDLVSRQASTTQRRQRISPSQEKIRTQCRAVGCYPLDVKGNYSGYRMAEVNSHRESGASEREISSLWPQPKVHSRAPEMAPFLGSAARSADEEAVRKGRLGGGTGTVVKPSPARFRWLMNHTNSGGCCLENRGLLWRSPPAREQLHT